MTNKIDELITKASQQAKERVGDDSRLEESANRAWQKISAASGTGAASKCEEFSVLISAYHEGTLDKAHATLLEEHMKECFNCRSRLRRLQSGKTGSDYQPAREMRNAPAWMKWGSIAAGLVIMIVAAQFLYWAGMLPGVSADAVTISSLQGSIYHLDGQEILPASSGEVYSYGQALRTGPGTRAVVTLQDGSKVELDERTEFDVVGGWTGDSIRLSRGNIIIQASEQGSGRLQVITEDCGVAVKGTIFSVRHGLKGSRVAVVEGEVWVKRGEDNTVLNAGQQYASREGLSLRSVEEEVAWSRNSSEYFEMLAAVTEIHRAIEEVAMSRELRYNGSLAGILPIETIVYGAAPNVVDRADILFETIEDAVDGNPHLSEIWNSEKGLEIQAHLDELKDLVFRMEGLFGEELIFAVSRLEGTDPLPILLTETLNPAALQAEINALNGRIAKETGGIPPFAVIEDPFAPGLPDPPFFAMFNNGLFALSPSLELLQQIVAADQAGGAGGFSESPLYETVASQYDQGVDWLLAVDFPSMLAAAGEDGDIDSVDPLVNPLAGISSLVAKRKLLNGEPENQVVFSFNEEPQGMLSWLAEPMPMGAMDFVSPDAVMAAGVSLRDPLMILDEILEHAVANNPDALLDLEEFESQVGIDVRNDIAAALGGEALVAVDGPILPTPAWKLILEVYDETSFQNAIEYLAEGMNAISIAEGGNSKLALYSEAIGGNTVYSMQMLESGTTIRYLFARGYMIAAPNYSIIDKALQYQSSGYSLANSPQFIASLPSGDSVDLSAFYYHDFRPIIDSLEEAVTTTNTDITGMLSYLETGSSHFMSGVYRTEDELVISSNNRFEDLLALFGMMRTFQGMAEEKAD